MRNPKDDNFSQEDFAHLDREGKILDWLIVGGFGMLIFIGIMWIRDLITQ